METRKPPSALVRRSVIGAVLGFCLLSRFLSAAGPPVFREAARETGLDFHHFIGATGEYFFPEIMGSGVGMFDYDGDGDLDLYFVQGAMLDRTREVSESSFPFGGKEPPRNRLFRNEVNPTGTLRFTDVTREAGVGDPGYGMGLAVGDYDSDGDPDLYLTNFGSNVLYRNDGDGTFTDVTRDAGVDDPRYSASSTFVDYDSDGDLDLFVANYVSFTIKGNRRCGGERRDYCAPDVYQPLPDRLFRNEGNGRFTDRSEEAGLGRAFGAGLGVVAVDLDLDRRVDIYVANDGNPNQLWINQGDGTFQDQGLVSGTAYNIDGMAEAGMGVTAADFDGDGDEDLFLTHNKKETNTLYLNGRQAGFADATSRFGLANPSVPYSGFGTLWFDYDNDGRLDLFVANGAVVMDDRQPADSAYPYAQENQLFRGDGTGRSREVGSDVAGPALDLVEVSRGAAFGDIDNDGDVDIAVANNNGPARLLLNQVGSRNHWLSVRLEGDGAAPSATYQARVALFRQGRKPLWRRCHTDGSYLSANDSRVLFGLGSLRDVDRVEVHWPDGLCESWSGVGVDRYVTLSKGTGRACE